MALDPVANARSLSPASSGRSSPVPRALPRREDGQKLDKTFRKYAVAIERSLALFETLQQEWADYISFLGRLLKVLQSRPSEPRIIPHSSLVATRLAQCLNPSLPSGVHQKTLEVYAHIFEILGTAGLATDLQLYFSGLSSVLSFASLSVRPAFLSLVETYVLPLDAQALRPALKAIILALLPGLEDESSEDFDGILNLVDRLRRVSVGIHALGPEKDTTATDAYFWQCFFLATITNASRRPGALAYLTRRLPRLSNSLSLTTPTPERRGSIADLSPEAQALVTPEPGLLVRCFAAGLSDQQLLVQRGFLDLLVTHVPLASPVLQSTVQVEDLQRLVIAAANVVNRKDMSLNRRLWAWFLGPDQKQGNDDHSPEDTKRNMPDASSHHAAYFSRFGLRPLATSLLRLIRLPGINVTERARPFRVCLSLMDRWEVGGLIVPDIFIPAVESVFSYSLTASKEQTDELIRSASLFFDGVESGLIWGKLFDLAMSAYAPGPLSESDRIQKLKLYLFVITRFNVREEEMILYHIPLSFLAILEMMRRIRSGSASFEASEAILNQSFQICEALIRLIPTRALAEASVSGLPKEMLASGSDDDSTVTEVVRKFYTTQNDATDAERMPYNSRLTGIRALRLTIQHFQLSLERQALIDQSVRLLNELLHKVPRPGPVVRQSGLLDSLKSSQAASLEGVPVPFLIVSATTTATAALRSVTSEDDGCLDDLANLIMILVQSLWLHLSPHDPKFHVEAVRCLWTLETISAPARRVESALSSLIHRSNGVDAGQRFAVIWNHTVQERSGSGTRGRGSITRRVSGMPGLPSGSSATIAYEAMLTRPLLAILDSLSEDGSELSAFTSTWLHEIPSLSMVFSILCGSMRRLACIRFSQRISPSAYHSKRKQFTTDDSNECIYYLHHVENILRRGSDHIWMTLAGENAPSLEPATEGKVEEAILQNLFAQMCMLAYDWGYGASKPQLQRVSLSVLQMILRSPFAAPLKEMELEIALLDRLQVALSDMNPLLQSTMLQAIQAALQLQHTNSSTTLSTSAAPAPPPPPPPPAPVPLESPSHLRKFSRDIRAGIPRLSNIAEKEAPKVPESKPPPQLIACLHAGFAAASSQMALDSWVEFFEHVLPLFADSIFQTMIPLVEIFCTQIRSIFGRLKVVYEDPAKRETAPDYSLISLMNGLEQLLGQAHQHLAEDEALTGQARSPDQPQGFFANMVPGVFSSEVQQISRSANANNRLTVLLCFQDAVRICFSLWTWGTKGVGREQDPASLASFGYTSLRIRNRARRLLEHLFEAEALECLETLCVLWCRPPSSSIDRPSVISVLNVLSGSKPKKTMPAIFNSLYSRTNPSALEQRSLSTLTSDLSDTEIVWFLLEYTRSLEDDAMDEIWTDCLTFLKDVLANPMPQRQVLPALLEFTTILAAKVENTNFGEERKMRRDLGELFLRLLTAIFTTRPVGFVQEFATKTSPTSDEKADEMPPRLNDVVAMLSEVTPKLHLVVGETDRLLAAATSISTNVISPSLHSKHFPDNVSRDTSALVQQLSSLPQASKAWRKDVADAFNDNRFFNIQRDLVGEYWLKVIFQLNVVDKEKMSDLLSRLTAPATAGIMFGVGATSARQAADRTAQLNLRRVATLVIACPEDTFASRIAPVASKISELLTATPVTSPSSTTRAEVFLLLRTLILKVSAIHLAPLWPIINAELARALASVLPNAENADDYDAPSLLQACKLLDVLVTLSPDDFQLYEWLFVTDTIDAVYRPPNFTSAALVDEIAEEMGASTPAADEVHAGIATHGTGAEGLRVPFLEPLIAAANLDMRSVKREEVIRRIVRPFFGQLSINAFEATYGMRTVDVEFCKANIVRDLFDESETAS